MDEKYKLYIQRCWVFAREASIGIPEISDYDQEIVLAIFNKVCQPYHYWKKEK